LCLNIAKISLSITIFNIKFVTFVFHFAIIDPLAIIGPSIGKRYRVVHKNIFGHFGINFSSDIQFIIKEAKINTY
jgi:hypothetical protein